MEISQRDARKLFLKQQGLLRDNEFGHGRNGVCRAINRLSYLQIDTISVVNRAHEHVAATRVGNFTPAHLDRLVKEKEIFEYWSHAASFLPFESYRYALPVMKGWRDSRRCDRKLAKEILSRIASEGALQSRDFEDTRKNKSSGWWAWKPAKQVLDHLFLAGELMVSHREGFQKVYDLPEKIIPSHINTQEPTIEEWCDFIVLSMIHALGVATEADLGYGRPTIRRLSKINLKAPIQAAILRLLEEGRLAEVTVNRKAYYSTPRLLDALPHRVNRKTVRLLSPFDNLVINRRRTAELFNFNYQLECYVPPEKRKYGYFALPLLHGDELAGRVDTKADRAAKKLIIRKLVLEDKTVADEAFIHALADGIRRFAGHHDCRRIDIQESRPDLRQPLRSALDD